MRNSYKILIRKSQEKREPRSRMEDNIKMDLKKTGCEIVYWIHMAQDTDQWQILVKMIITSGFHKRWEISGPAECLSASQ
jgi:hypothetical protein